MIPFACLHLVLIRIQQAVSRALCALLIGLILIYQYLLSPWIGRSCRFHPTCSHYAIEALQTHGLLYGSWLTFYRLLRCQPFCYGGEDPVPPKRPTHSPSSSSLEKSS